MFGTLPDLAMRPAGHPKLPSISQLGLAPSPPPSPPHAWADPFLPSRRLLREGPPRIHGHRAQELSDVPHDAFSFPSTLHDRGVLNSGFVAGLSWHGDREPLLPSVCHLLRSVPAPPTSGSAYPALPPTPLQPSPARFPSPHPAWPALPPRRRSVPSLFSGFLPPPQPAGPRRASTDCSGSAAARSFSVPGRSSPGLCSHRASPERGRGRQQRRHTKQAHRLRDRRGSHSSLSSCSSSGTFSSFSSCASDHAVGTSFCDAIVSTAATTPGPEDHLHQQRPRQQVQKKQPQQPPKQKRNNKPYTFEQEAFFIYHRVDLEQTWAQVRDAYMARWPGLRRTVSGLESAYYRTNLHVPLTTPDGLLVLADGNPLDHVGEAEEVGDGEEVGVMNAGEEDEGGVEEEGEDEEGEREEEGGLGMGRRVSDVAAVDAVGLGLGFGAGARVGEGGGDSSDTMTDGNGHDNGNGDGNLDGVINAGYKLYRGVAYRTRRVMCRSARISLMQRFPEELVDEANDWVREEHRVLAREIAERRRRQREEWLAARAK